MLLTLLLAPLLGGVLGTSKEYPGPRGWELREALAKLDPELYGHAPAPERPYVEDAHSPCWVVPDGARCLPAAMILGGFQCGAASLYQAVNRHPLVVKTGVSRWHFWAEFDKSLAAYLGGLKDGAARVMQWHLRVVRGGDAAAGVAADVGTGAAAALAAGDPQVAGSPAWLRTKHRVLLDGSSSTFAFYWSPGVRAHRAFISAMGPCWKACHSQHREGPERDACLEGCFGPARAADRKMAADVGLPYRDVSLPLLLSAVYGKRPPRMVVLLRNPVDRLYSAFWSYYHYQNKYGNTTEGFAAYVADQLPALRACMARNGSATEEECLLGFETWGLREERLFFHGDQILRGVYSLYMEGWLRFFDRSQLLILRSESYFADPVGTYDRVLRFLDLDPDALPYKARIDRAARLAAGPLPGGTWERALATPASERLRQDIQRGLTTSPDGRYEANRAAATLAAMAAGGGAAAAAVASGASYRPPMPADVRRELAAFYAPYNQRLAELLGDPDFIRGWG